MATMATTTSEQALSLLATANNHGDLAVKLSSLRQFKSLLLSSSSDLTSSLASDVFPFLFELHSSPQPLVRKFLLEVIEEIGLRVLDQSSPLVPVLLALVKDEDSSVAHQSIITGMKFFCAIIQAIAWQFHRHGKIEIWAEEIWPQMIAYKDAVCSLVIEPVSIKTKLLAFKFLETCVLLFTQDTDDYDRPTTGVIEDRFSISWLPSGHPVLDPVLLKSEANKLSSCLLDMLHSSRNLPGPVTIAIVNCLTAIARKRPDQYGRILSALLDFHLKLVTSREGHLASLQYSVRSALLGFLRCTHPAVSESKDRLVKLLRSMNAGDAADQALRQVEKLMRNSEWYSRDVRISKGNPPSSQSISSGDDMKKRPIADDDKANGAEVGSKRLRYTTNGVLSDIAPTSESRDDNPTANEISSTVPMLDDNLNAVEQMIAVISAFLAEGERGAKSLELLVSQIHHDLLADIVISNMKNLPKNLPQVKPVSLPFNPQNSSPENVVQITTPKITNMSAPSVHPITPESTTTIPVNSSLHDVSVYTNHPADSRRDPRRDPRRLDPRRVVVSAEAPLIASADETNVNSRLKCPASANESTSLRVAPSVDIMLPQAVQDARADDKITSLSMVSETKQETPKEEPVEESREKSPSSVIRMSVDQALPANVAVDESSEPLMLSETALNDASDTSFLHVSDDYSCDASNNTASKETCVELPQVPSFVDFSQDQRQGLQKMAVEQIVRSYKQLKVKDLCQTRIALIARLISWMDDDNLMAILVQEEMVLGYRDQQGHELVMHILYHLHGLKTTESSDQSVRAADLYEKFLLGVARSMLNALPASDKFFSRLLGEAPILTDSVVKLLENLCCSHDSSQQGKDIREDRVTQGLGVVWSLILGRPHYRQTCLDIALKCAVHTEDDIRARAIRLVANKLYPLKYVSETIEQFSINMLLSAADCTPDADASQFVTELTGEDASVSGSQHCEPSASVGSIVNVEQGASQSVASVSFSEAQRLISLYFALCTKKPCLLQLLFNVYARFGKSVKRAIHRHVPILLRALGSSYSELFRIMSDPPNGSENLIVLVLQVLAEQGTPSPDLISTVKNLYETKFKDAAILIPILSSFSKDEVLPIFPRLVELPLDKFQEALAHVLQGTAHTGPALTPAEVLVAIHDIVPEKEGITLKKVMDACSACFEQRTVFTQHVLAKALNQMVDRTPLPLLFMRTVIQAIDAFPTLVDFVMEILSKLVNRQIWKLPKLWVGFLKCVSQTQPHSSHVLLQLPVPQLESALNKYANLRSALTAYASQTSIRSSLPRSTLSVLGLANEPHLTQHMGSEMRTSEASSVHRAMST